MRRRTEWTVHLITRSITSLIFSGASQKYRDIKWILSHGGGGLTAFAERFLVQMVTTPPYQGKFTREMVQAELNRFHYDTAQVSLDGTIAALAKLAPISPIVYGTDFPYRPAAEQSKGVDFAEDDRKRVKRSIALGRAKPRCLLFGDDTALPAIAAVLELPAPRLAANMLNL